MSRFLISFVMLCALTATPAMAYVGPGSGLGAIGIAFGVVGTVLLSLVSFVWYPVKRMHRSIRKALGRRRGAEE